MHHQYPDISDFTDLILEALSALNLSINKFDWKIKPVVTNLNEEVFQECLSILKKKRKKNRTLLELYTALLLDKSYLNFSEEDLENWLRLDERLEFKSEGIVPLIIIK